MAAYDVEPSFTFYRAAKSARDPADLTGGVVVHDHSCLIVGSTRSITPSATHILRESNV